MTHPFQVLWLAAVQVAGVHTPAVHWPFVQVSRWLEHWLLLV